MMKEIFLGLASGVALLIVAMHIEDRSIKKEQENSWDDWLYWF